MGLLLKVLSGPHQGAEFDIPEEEIIIGAADECDVIISDALVADRHAKFGHLEGRIFITPLDGNVFVDGKLLRKSTTIDNFKFITIGATHMMMGEAESEHWRTISLGDFPELEKIEEEVATFNESLGPSAETIEEGPINGTNKIKDQEAEDIKEIELKSRKVTQADKANKIKLTLKQKIARYSVGFIICCAITLAGSIGYVLWRDYKSAPLPKPDSIENRVRNVVNALKLHAKLKISKANEDSPVSVVGYVDTLEESATVKAAIKNVGEDVLIKVLSMEKLVNKATEIVQQSKQNVVLKKSEEFGKIIAMGYIKKAENWEKLKTEIKSIKGIIDIKDEVLVKDSAIELAKDILSKHKFKEKLEISINDLGLEIKGTISDNDKEGWAKTRDDLEKTFKKKAQLSFMISVSTDRNVTIEKFFGGKIDSVNFNNQGLDWINIKDGNKYFQGSVLPSGYVIDLIEQDSVTIKNADDVIKLDFNWI
ncbi:MAG: type III secretion system inner membrane ring subunit SctD [Holosporaceae bacterium]|jgi:type III secretion system YscD/HrpQ family protein|nr:type III secretion system inner membrane ring subunit SctD [Holosporaceae bacterium]